MANQNLPLQNNWARILARIIRGLLCPIIVVLVAIIIHQYLGDDSSEYKIKLDKCQGELKKSETKESETLVNLTKCQTASETKENYELKGLDSKCNERILKLEKDNATCHNEIKNFNTNFQKCKDEHVSCQKKKETQNEDIRNITAEYARCDEQNKLCKEQTLIENENKNKANDQIKKRNDDLYTMLETCEKDKQKCEDEQKNKWF